MGMFLSNMKESKNSEVELKNVGLETITSVISFMYSNDVDRDKIDIDLLAAANMYQIPTLKSICCQELTKCMDIDNVIEIWEAALLFDIENLAHDGLVFMVRNWKTLAMNDDMKKLCLKYPNLIFSISTLLVSLNEYEVSN